MKSQQSKVGSEQEKVPAATAADRQGDRLPAAVPDGLQAKGLTRQGAAGLQALQHVDGTLRRAYVRDLGRRHGNRHVQRLLRGVRPGLTRPAGTIARTEDPQQQESAPAAGEEAAVAEDPATSATVPDFDPSTTIDGDTPAQLDLILQNSRYLKPYIQEKISSKPIADTDKFIVYESDPDFDEAYIRIHKKWDKLDDREFQARLGRIMGFYERANDAIHLRKGADRAQALHEAIHRYSEPQFRGIFTRFGDEGATQFFADKVLEELGQPAGGSHGYDEELAFATDLIAFLGEPFAAENYFKELDRHAVLAKLGVTWEEFNEKYRFEDRDKERFMRYLKKLLRGAPPRQEESAYPSSEP